MYTKHEINKLWPYWYPRVYAYFYKRVGLRYEVEELTANTLSTVFTAKNVRSLNAYMWRVSHNYLVNYINAKNIQPTIVSIDEETDSFSTEIENTVSPRYTEKFDHLKTCIENNIKNSQELEFIRLCVHEEKTSNQVGQELNLNPANVRKKLSRLLNKLRDQCRQLWPFKETK